MPVDMPYEDELMHYGVMGMKWGVRKKPETRGERYGRRAAKIDASMAKRAAKIKKADRHLVTRVTSGDVRRGVQMYDANRSANLKRKQSIANAKDAYKSGASTKAQYKSAKTAANNSYIGSKARGNATTASMQTYYGGLSLGGTGTYRRNRDAGKGVINSAIRAYGRDVAIGAAITAGTAAAKAGAGAVSGMMKNRGIYEATVVSSSRGYNTSLPSNALARRR